MKPLKKWVLPSGVALVVALLVLSLVPMVACPNCTWMRKPGTAVFGDRFAPGCGRCGDWGRVSLLNRWMKGGHPVPEMFR